MRDREEDVRRAGATLVAVGMGEPWKARAFRDEFHIGFPLLVDEDRVAYRAAGLLSAGVGQLLLPSTWKRVRAAKKAGFRQVANGPHPFQLGGSFVLAPGDVDLFAGRSLRVGEEPPIDDLLAALRPA